MTTESKNHNGARPAAVLVGLQLPLVSDIDHTASMQELTRLCHTLGFDVIQTISQKRKAPQPGTVVGEGKLRELARLTGGTGKIASLAPKSKGKKDGDDELEVEDLDVVDEFDADELDGEADGEPVTRLADKVVFDTELTPNQIRNLESALGAEVLDRTGVIVEIFHRHARTREARLQVEIARLRYLAPRMRATRTGERQGGGIGAKGVGETAHELDSRRIRDRIAELQRELEGIKEEDAGRRKRRVDQARVALVGYTNAGKSSLMRALTQSEVLVEDKLFATLDTTIRVMQPESVPRILVSDTVGFIKKLPHDLVASFRSTLDEAGDAAVQLHVVDGADPSFRSQLAVTKSVLAEIGADQVPAILVLNKMDKLSQIERAALTREFPEAMQVSTRDPADVQKVKDRLRAFFEKDMVEETIRVPFDKGALVGEVHRSMRVISETYDEEGTHLTVRAAPADLKKFKKSLGN